VARDRLSLGTVAADYAARAGTFGQVEAALRRQADRVSQLRLMAFVVAAASGIALLGGRGPTALVSTGLVGALAVYAWAAKRTGPALGESSASRVSVE
jgi:hypothetical protein